LARVVDPVCTINLMIVLGLNAFTLDA
jgi:hypothetical protein